MLPGGDTLVETNRANLSQGVWKKFLVRFLPDILLGLSSTLYQL